MCQKFSNSVPWTLICANTHEVSVIELFFTAPILLEFICFTISFRYPFHLRGNLNHFSGKKSGYILHSIVMPSEWTITPAGKKYPDKKHTFTTLKQTQYTCALDGGKQFVDFSQRFFMFASSSIDTFRPTAILSNPSWNLEPKLISSPLSVLSWLFGALLMWYCAMNTIGGEDTRACFDFQIFPVTTSSWL